MTLKSRLSPLRSQHIFPTLRLALLRAARRDPARFRLLHFSVQRDHLHLIVEAANARALSSGMRSIAIRIARYVNELLSRRGPLWAERWHGRALKTPREVRHVLVYVLANFRKHVRAQVGPTRRTDHGASAGAGRASHDTLPGSTATAGIDPFSSGEWFDGWRGWTPCSGVAPPFAERAPWNTRSRPREPPKLAHRATDPDESSAPVVTPPRTWLAQVGWRSRGLIALDEAPSATPRTSVNPRSRFGP